MKITTFNNMKGLIHGSDPNRIGCEKSGTLKIGTSEIKISAESESIMPALCSGCTGRFNATFTDDSGSVYTLEPVTLISGRITPPPATAVEIMELRCKADASDRECEKLREELQELKNIFDTNSLNFLIK